MYNTYMSIDDFLIGPYPCPIKPSDIISVYINFCLIIFFSRPIIQISHKLYRYFFSFLDSSRFSIFSSRYLYFYIFRYLQLVTDLKVNPYMCKKCPYSVAKQSYMNYHMRVAHEGLQYLCSVCGKVFNHRCSISVP